MTFVMIKYFFVSIATIGFLLAPESANADISIMKYDSKGRPISTQKVDPLRRTPSKAPAKQSAPSKSVGDSEPGELLFLSHARNARKKVTALGFDILDEASLDSIGATVLRLRVPNKMNATKALKLLRKRFPTATVDRNHQLNPSGANIKPVSDYSRKMIGWGKVPPSCGSNLRIGMIDGIPDTKHPILQGQNVITRSFVGKALPAVMDHSTSIASIFVGKPYKEHAGGLLPGAALYAGGIFRRLPDGSRKGSLMAFLKALNWLAEQRVSVVNLSLVTKRNKVIKKILQRSRENGQVLVASASNNGPRAKTPYPAGYRQVISVTAIDSKWKVFKRASHGDFVDFAAPGVNLILTKGKGFTRRSGTSYSAPFIASLAALLIAGGNQPDPDTLRASLKRYVVDLGRKGHDPVYGYGVVRARPPC